MGQLTTHVLDLSAGSPAAGVRIEVQSAGANAGVGVAAGAGPGAPNVLARVATGKDGRCAAPLLAGAGFRAGRYVLTYYLAEYFRNSGVVLPEPAFLEEAVLRIGIAHADQHYHVPLLISPWSYSVYRGG